MPRGKHFFKDIREIISDCYFRQHKTASEIFNDVFANDSAKALIGTIRNLLTEFRRWENLEERHTYDAGPQLKYTGRKKKHLKGIEGIYLLDMFSEGNYRRLDTLRTDFANEYFDN